VEVVFSFREQVADPASQTTGSLPTVCPDVTKLLAVMTLREATLSPVCLYPDRDVAKAIQLENFLGFGHLGRVIRKWVRFLVPSEDDRRVVICLTLTTSNPKLICPSEISFAGV
jgi:hypothetical protein